MAVSHMISAPGIFHLSTLLLKKIETKCEKLKLLTSFLLRSDLFEYDIIIRSHPQAAPVKIRCVPVISYAWATLGWV